MIDSWKKELKVGDLFVKFYDGLVIYGEIINVWEEDKHLYNLPHMTDTRFTKCYSNLCIEGEVGNTNLSTVSYKITKNQFNIAKKHNWPSESKSINTLLNVVRGGVA